MRDGLVCGLVSVGDFVSMVGFAELSKINVQYTWLWSVSAVFNVHLGKVSKS